MLTGDGRLTAGHEGGCDAAHEGGFQGRARPGISLPTPRTQGPVQKKGVHTYGGALFPFAGDSSKPEFQACHLFPLPLFLPIFGALDFLPHAWTWRNRRLVWYSTNNCPPNHPPP